MMATVRAIKASRRAKYATTKRLQASLADLRGVNSRVIDFDNADVYLRLEGKERLILVTFAKKGHINRLDIDDDASLSWSNPVDPDYDEAVEIIGRVFARKEWRKWSLKRAKERLSNRTGKKGAKNG